MGICTNLYVGPYATFRVPKGTRKRLPPETEEGDPLFGDSLYWDLGLEAVTPGGSLTCMPLEKRKGHPHRQLFAFDCPPDLSQDLIDVDREAEVEWFRTAFATELDVLAGHFKGTPSFHWGVVAWYS